MIDEEPKIIMVEDSNEGWRLKDDFQITNKFFFPFKLGKMHEITTYFHPFKYYKMKWKCDVIINKSIKVCWYF